MFHNFRVNDSHNEAPGPSGIVIPETVDTTSLIAAWNLNELSGTRSDEIGSFDLTDVNTVGNNTGIISNAAQFVEANDEALTWADTGVQLSTNDADFTITAWAYLDSKPAASMTVVANSIASPASTKYLLWWNQSVDRFQFLSSLVSGISVLDSVIGSPSLDTWYFFVCWYDTNDSNFHMEINGGATQDGGGVETFNGNASQFQIGGRPNIGGGSGYWDGRIDAVTFWKRVLTSDERATMYNSGAGREAPF